MIRYEQCPVCGSNHIQRVLSAIDHTVSFESFEVWQCAGCSLRFTQNVPPEHEIGRYYRSENYISHTETNKGIVNRLYLLVRNFTLRTKKNFISSQTGLSRGNLLDFGAGSGAFLHYMKQHGWQTEGVEPDARARSRASAQYNISLQPPGKIFEFQDGSFDAITMWHVLEHVHALHEAVSRLKTLLKPNGKLFIAVPNYTSFDAEKYGESWAAYDVPRHLYHFSPASMHALMQKHLLKVEKMQPMWFDSFYVSMLSEKYKHGGSGLVTGSLTGLRSNLRAMSNARKASSIIYVISRN